MAEDGEGVGRDLQMYVKDSTGCAATFRDRLKNYIKSKYDTSIQYVDIGADIKENVPVLVICCNATRIGADIDHALSEVNVLNKQQVAIVVVHTTADHVLPIIPPTDHMVDEKYLQHGLLVDYFITPEQGTLNRCELNNIAHKKLHSFLKINSVGIFAAVSVILLGCGVLAGYMVCDGDT